MNGEKIDRLIEFVKLCEDLSHQPKSDSPVGTAMKDMMIELGIDTTLRQRLYKYRPAISAMTGREVGPIDASSFLTKHGRDVLGDDLAHINDRITCIENELADLTTIKDTLIRLDTETSDIIGIHKHCVNEYQDAIFDYNMKGGNK